VATALVAEIGDWKAFRSGRNLAAWIGLVPKQHSTGGKEWLGSITKQGNRYLRWLLVAGAMAVIRYARQHGTTRLWLTRKDTKSRSCCWQREYTNWRGHDDVMQTRSLRGSGEPVWVSAL
jgi:transposase